MKRRFERSRGIALVMAMIFLMVFGALAVSMMTMSGVNLQVADNHHKVNSALSAAESGLECGRLVLASYIPTSTYDGGGDVTLPQAEEAWSALCDHVEANIAGGAVVPDSARFTDALGSGDQIITSPVNFGSADVAFQIRFYRYDTDPYTIKLQSIGIDDSVARRITIDVSIEKDTSILKYAVASKSRVIITGDSTIEGDIYSTWDRPDIAPPFEMEATSRVNGTLNTVVDESYFDPSDADYVGYELEGGKVNGTHQGLNYGQPKPTLKGFDYTDYDTSAYEAMTSTLPASGDTVKEYFPHAPGDYTQPANWSSDSLNRQVYENETFTDRRLPAGRNSLFKNCTFEGVFYIAAGGNGCNNIRFENCNFNGVLVTGVPNDFKWKKNMLYFTGSAMFDNRVMEEATILAPNFNVNLGNTQEIVFESESVLTGLVVGGIVDVRGNANIDGTILSMYDPGPLGNVAAQYGTNVGFSDENGEAGVPEDVGTINIHSDPDRMLPVGIKTSVILVPSLGNYTEY